MILAQSNLDVASELALERAILHSDSIQELDVCIPRPPFVSVLNHVLQKRLGLGLLRLRTLVGDARQTRSQMEVCLFEALKAVHLIVMVIGEQSNNKARVGRLGAEHI